MINKKGFTLVEMLTTVIVVSILLLIAVPNIIGIVERVKIDAYNDDVDIIEGVARQYVISNDQLLCNMEITLQELYDEGYLNEPVIDPRTNKLIHPMSFVRVTCINGEHSFYFYNIDDDSTVPTISLLGDNPITLEKGVDTYFEYSATAYDELEGDLTSSIQITEAVDENIVGTYLVTYYVVDTSGNSATIYRTVNVVDTIAPETPNLNSSNLSLTNSDITVTITLNDDAVRSEYKIESSSWLEYVGPFSINNNATIYARSYDGSDNVSSEVQLDVSNIDKDAPLINISPNNSDLLNSSIDVTISASDGYAGLDYFYYEISTDNGLTWGTASNNLNTDKTITLDQTGLNIIRVNAFDILSNTLEEYSGIYVIDVDIPDTPTLVSSNTADTNLNISVSATYPTDGVNNEIKIGTGSWTSYAGPLTILSNTTVYARTFDAAGNESLTDTLIVNNIDKTVPSIVSTSISGCTYQTGNDCWIKSGTTMNFNIRALEEGSGLATTAMRFIGASDNMQANHNWNGTNSNFTLDDPSVQAYVTAASETYENSGTYETQFTITSGSNLYLKYLEYQLMDNTTNTLSWTASSYRVGVDNDAPTVTFGTNGNTTAAQSHSTTITVDDNISDYGSGIKIISYIWSTSTSAPSTGYTTTTNGATLTKNSGTGNYYLYIKMEDNIGNTRTTRSNYFNIDNTVPSTPTLVGSSTSWTNSSITVTGNYSSDSSIKQYKVGTGAWTTYTSPITITSNTSVYARSYDASGNRSSTRTLTISNIDKIIPTGVYSPNNGTYNMSAAVSFNPSDSGGSGVNYWTYQISTNDGSTYNSPTTVVGDTTTTINLGTIANNKIKVIVYDNAGNSSNIVSGTYDINLPDVSKTWINDEYGRTGSYTYYTIPYSGTYRITAYGGGTVYGDGAKIRGDFYLESGTKLIMLVGAPGKTSSSGAGGTYVTKEVTSSSYETYNGYDVTPLVVAGGAAGYKDGSGDTSTSEGGGRGDNGGGGFASDASSTYHGGESFLSGGEGGLGTGSSWGSFGGGGGADNSEDGGGGGWHGGAGEAGTTTPHAGGTSYNSGSNQSNSTGGNTNNEGKITLELIGK